MYKVILTIVLLTFSIVYPSFSETIILKGKVISAKDSVDIKFATIVDKQTKQSALCDKNGSFNISVYSGDTIIFLALGFQSRVYNAESLLKIKPDLVISLIPQVYEIDTVEIAPYKTYDELKQAIINLNLPVEKKLDLNIEPLPADKPYRLENGQAVYSLGSPITALYNQFSKRGKELRMYQELVAKKEIENKVAKKYNKELVSRLTGITDEKEIQRFMAFCNLSNDFVLSNTDYAIYKAIDICFEEYKKIRN